MRPLTLALAQTNPELGNLEGNLSNILKLIEEAGRKGADFVVFPELALTGYNQELLGDKLLELALNLEDKPMKDLNEAACDSGLYVAVGFIEKRTIPGVIFNSIALFSPESLPPVSVAKVHLFTAEKLHFRAGSELKTFKIKHGTVGLFICMDIGYPEASRILALQGAELLIAPSCWIREDEDLWELHLRARALDNLLFVAGCNRAGVEGNLSYIGQSMMVDPRGHVISRLKRDDEDKLLVTKIDLDEVPKARRRALHWLGRRPELYGPVSDVRVD